MSLNIIIRIEIYDVWRYIVNVCECHCVVFVLCYLYVYDRTIDAKVIFADL